MTTRRASFTEPLSQERYMSSPEYSELRCISGTAVAARAALLTDPKEKALLFFIQEMSRRPGGLKKLVADLLAMSAARVGTPLMRKLGTKPGTIYQSEDVKAVRRELEGTIVSDWDDNVDPDDGNTACRFNIEHDLIYCGNFPLPGEYNPPDWPRIRWNPAATMAEYKEQAAGSVAEWVAENKARKAMAAKNPRCYPAAAFADALREPLTIEIEEHLVESCINPACSLGVKNFWALQEALFQFKARHEEAARASIAQTAVTLAVRRTLARGLRTRKIVVVNGEEGLG
ncbi:MAG: hypothetical protein QOF48_1511, partial [Verrucomicrobiota bacterium]